MFLDETLDQRIGERLIRENEAESAKHNSSGRLSAGMLGKPLQVQILKAIGVPQKKFDAYTLKKFKRGTQVEDWMVGYMGEGEEQVFAQYRDCIGYIDKLIKVTDYYDPAWVQKVGSLLPREIKSVTNMKFKRISNAGGKGHPVADRGHRLQGAMYALAKGTDYFCIDYVASDDFRILSLIHKTADSKAEVDKAIQDFYDATQNGRLPAFEPAEAWMGKPEWADYPEWVELSSEEALKRLQTQYPEQYGNLKNYPAYVAGLDAEREARAKEVKDEITTTV